MKKKFYITNSYLFVLCLIIILNINVFYLVDYDRFHCSDIAILLEIIFCLLYCFKFGLSFKEVRYGKWVAAAIIFAGMSAYGAFLSYGQPIILGLRPQRAWLCGMLMYFPIVSMLKKKLFTIEDIVKMVEDISIIFIFLIILQWLFPDVAILKSVIGTSDVYRYGSIRLRVDISYLVMLFYFEIVHFLYHRNTKIRQLIIILGTGFIILFVTKSRMRMLIIAFCVSLMIVLDKKTIRKYKIAASGILITVLFCMTSYGFEIARSFFDKNFNSFGREVRDIGRTFFIERIFSSVHTMVFGVGYMNTRWEPAVIAARYKEYISYDDNGIIGLMFYYGVIFAIWVIAFSCILIRDSKKAREFGAMLYIISGLVGMYTLFPACYHDSIIFALLCSIIEYRLLLQKKSEIAIKG